MSPTAMSANAPATGLRPVRPAPPPLTKPLTKPLATATRVVHVNRDRFDVYIGRAMAHRRDLTPTGWGNPFFTRPGFDAIDAYHSWLLAQPHLLARLHLLAGKTLGCWCAPKGGLSGNVYGHVCHGELLAALADEAANTRAVDCARHRDDDPDDDPDDHSEDAEVHAKLAAAWRARKNEMPLHSCLARGAQHLYYWRLIEWEEAGEIHARFYCVQCYPALAQRTEQRSALEHQRQEAS